MSKIALNDFNICLVQNVVNLSLLLHKKFSFCSKHSTADQIVKAAKSLLAGLHFKEIDKAIFLDVLKAFDTV